MVLIALHSDSATKKEVTKTIYQFKIIQSSTLKAISTYFTEWNYKNGRLKIRLKMSKNQVHKYKKYGTIPSIPLNKIGISNFSEIVRVNKTMDKVNYKKKQSRTFRLDIGGLKYDVSAFENIDLISKKDHKILEKLILNSILY